MADQALRPTLTAEEAASYSLSIRPTSGGLAFCICPITRDGVSFSTFLPYSSSEAPLYKMIEELYYQDELLSLPYAATYLYYEPNQATLVPDELLISGQEALWLTPQRETEEAESVQRKTTSTLALSYRLPDETKSFVLAWDQEAYHFLRRTLLLLETRPYLAPTLETRRAHTRRTRGYELLVQLREKHVDCFLLREGELVAFNTYAIVRSLEAREIAGEVMYYIVALWRHFSLSPDADHIHVSYPCEGVEQVTSLLKASAECLHELLKDHITSVQVEPYQTLTHQ